MFTRSKSPITTPPRTKGQDKLPPTPDSTNYNPRKRVFVADPTYSPTRDKHRNDTLTHDAHDDNQMHREAVAEQRPGRKVRIVDPTYNPRHEPTGDTDEEETGTTQVSPGKRKRVDAPGKQPGTGTGTKRARTGRSPSPFPTSSSSSEEATHDSSIPVASSGNTDDLEVTGRRTVTPSHDMPKMNRKGKGILKPQKDGSYMPSQQPSNQKSSSVKGKRKATGDGAAIDEDEEYTEPADMSKSEKKTAYDFSLERARRWAAAVSLPETWSTAEKELFFRLAMRGFEPLLPQHWRHDFSTLPETLFSSPKNGKVPVVWPFRELDFHGKLKC